MRKVLLFDFDGTLAATLDNILRHATYACSRLGYATRATKEDLDNLENMLFDELGRHMNVPEEEIEAFVAYVFEAFASEATPPPVVPGMSEVIARLAEVNRLGLVTGNSRKTVADFLDYHKLSEYFSALVTVDDRGTRCDKILKAAREVGSRNAGVTLIGDAVSDIRAARAASVKSVAVTWGHQSQGRLELEAPDHIAHSPADLLLIL